MEKIVSTCLWMPMLSITFCYYLITLLFDVTNLANLLVFGSFLHTSLVANIQPQISTVCLMCYISYLKETSKE